MKLCQQCFHFLERSYLWTFQVLYRYISDLSFLCAVILACHFYLSYKLQLMSWPHPMAISALNFPPMHLHDAGSPGLEPQRMVSPLTVKMAQDTGLRGMHQDPGSGMPEH